MIDHLLVDLSRLQFALTAMYHFLFVPLTLGLSILIAMMETVYVMTGRAVWRDMTRFWGVLFGINFALGVATGITMEFQFGMNWAYYSHYVGDVFGAPLAIEGLMAFFLEATFVGLFFFGWERLSARAHLAVTWLMALGTNFSALWILIANGWMQNPVGAAFNPDTMRMEVTDFIAVLFNPVAQAKFVHTVSAGYVCGATFVLGVSGWYLLRGRHVALAKRSFVIASAFGLASALSVIVLGDESGYALTDNQKMKLAAIEAMWETEPPPAPFTAIGIPSKSERKTYFAIHIPWVMGLIGTRSIDKPIAGIDQLVDHAKERIRNGITAYDALERLKVNRSDSAARKTFDTASADLGYALLLKQFVEDPRKASPQQIDDAAWSTVPQVPTLFFAFRFMVLGAFILLAVFAVSLWHTAREAEAPRWLFRLAVLALPIPWIAIELGWLVAEFGRQPWIIEGVLPTFLATSQLGVTNLLITITGFTVVYGVLAIIEVRLMLAAIRKGPEVADVVDALSPAPSRLQPAE
ncbi:cytochrome ubiquinol oxidase subunit I [Bradyrhizobium sp. U87765 SZCCT0131]|uniref:cytochrome ubiquinol oxidase subunit I n=1 Tax=unclassified Bradyrhizobium TaxID=2631580 RepID=UPI001BA6D6CE|nr:MULTISPECIES: cytochrome ubiquinol oxidase subunit I [unclassified Bradyrhizobium]MBR1221599.1 cytochrome ubiquinol oxidase subunit I [Bradyrhizobium sp. U87765 SZCCT0131]MBR1264478.1 cytochrome ubiquinol oxidase subunit I [Bradyrhizobium sp. U87765 SZCCT0134]MBR1304615.1 cytochrome ubiquinol oxidase subunit I [Bradyrhizobium sp. U87765 SZCCT0110]MBR1322528.1 cytochrome ubiquinol oxidase subunit I [Bradyrhizobium sp. U87765 SZCCT0109]MBR1346544.1 cytochrome ubiquinol oxidase subunit I [Brad